MVFSSISVSHLVIYISTILSRPYPVCFILIMSSPKIFPSFISIDAPARCGRRGCGKHVANGMACDQCSHWFHPNCTGLSESQYEAMNNQGRGYKCVSCTYSDSSNSHPVAPTFPQAVTPSSFDKVIDAIASLHMKIDTLGNEMSKRFSQLTDTLYKVGSGISEKPLSTE